MTWEEYNKPKPMQINRYVKTDIECPKCGKLVYLDSQITLTSCPEQYRYECECGWVGTSYRAWGE